MDRGSFTRALEAAYRARQLTRTHVHVGYKLAGWRTSTPSHAALARSAGCSVSTVRRALARMHALGLLTWTRRVLASPGWRAQIANAYSLLSNLPVSFSCLKMSARLNTSAPDHISDPQRAARIAAKIAEERAAIARQMRLRV